jgi:ATP-binding cassette subfamily B protein
LFLFMMIMPLGQAFGAITSVNQALGALGRIQEIISLPSETEGDREDPTPATNQTSLDIALEFEGVTFSYPKSAHKTEAEKLLAKEFGDDFGAPSGAEDSKHSPEQRPVLDGVSFRIPAATTTAIVGPSGAGKSSVLSLMERFYDPQSGTIRVFGRETQTLPRSVLRSYFGYVEQDAPVLAGTIRGNLTIGAPDATDEQLRAVLDEVNLTSILDRDVRGLDAEVGEAGVLLSGGERQRLAIARALLQACPILLLDESTSSLDGPNELLMKNAIDKVSKERTVIVIAHRLATIRNADRIMVLNQGELIESGTHDELLARGGLYADLCRLQFAA